MFKGTGATFQVFPPSGESPKGRGSIHTQTSDQLFKKQFAYETRPVTGAAELNC